MTPYKEEKEGNCIIREFTEQTNEVDLVWHRDAQDRKITPIQCDGWMFQYDNERPFVMTENVPIFIKKNKYHRIIKGKGDLVLEILIDETR